MGRRALLVDALLAAGLAALNVLLLAGLGDLPVVPYALSVVHAGALALRRRATLAAFATGFAAAVAYVALGWPVVGLGPAALVWTYSLGWLVPPPRSLWLLGVVEASVVATTAVGGQGDNATMASNVVVLAVAYLLGDAARRRGLAVEQLRRTRDEEARRAVAEERLRIARELHDVVAHSMSVIAVQAGTGRVVLDREPAKAREALTVIEETSRGALDEMRRLLGVLRDPSGTAPGREPAPGLADLDALAARAGMPVTVRVEGERRALPQGLELAAYRIVQEALTNVARHAPGAPATVVVTYGEGLTVEVRNAPGRRAAAPPAGAGLGLLGMRERAAVYGGVVDAGPTTDGGWRVATTLREGP